MTFIPETYDKKEKILIFQGVQDGKRLKSPLLTKSTDSFSIKRRSEMMGSSDTFSIDDVHKYYPYHSNLHTQKERSYIMQEVPLEVLSWLKLHFGPSSFHGRLQVAKREQNHNALRPIHTCDRDRMMDYIAHLQVKEDCDYYITANCFCGVKRQMSDLFSLNNIVIDIDCHQKDLHSTYVENLLEQFLLRFEADREIPTPSSIVFTGRGLQLWWALKPLHEKCKPYYDEVKSFFIQELENLIKEYPSELSELQVDRVASCNAIGYFRLPGTMNPKINKKVKLQITDTKPIYILQELTKIMEELKVKSTPTPNTFSVDIRNQEKTKEIKQVNCEQNPEIPVHLFKNEEIAILKNFHTVGFFRIQQLLLLRTLRNCSIGTEERNNFCFLAYNTFISTLDHETAWEKLLIFNSGFKAPMLIPELEQCIVTAKKKRGYRYSNKKIIEFLQITPSEQKQIGLFVPTKEHEELTKLSRNPSREASRKLVKAHRTQRIIELYQQEKKDVEIAKELNISHVTVSKILKEIKAEKRKLITDEILKYAEKGVPQQQIAQKLNISVATIARILRKERLSFSKVLVS